jgi:GNAT superfamily N-acetyltransferase
MLIKQITENKHDFLPLLLLGDEVESSIMQYLDKGDLFALYDDDLRCVCALTDEGESTLEVQNLATDKRYQRRGYASAMLNHVCAFYHGKYDRVILGTGDVPGTLLFYQKNGFEITHRVPDFFTHYCDYPIIEDGVILKDKIYLERKLVGNFLTLPTPKA